MWARWLYPELRYFPDRQYGRDVVERYMRVNGVGVKVLLLLVFGVLPGIGLAASALERVLAPATALAVAAIGVPFGLLVAVLVDLRPRVRRFLREKLAYAGFAICVTCGYDLRGQTEPRCPECGAAFDPTKRRAPLPKVGRR